ncbi:IS66 family transposase [Rubrivivax sp. RP6-9]|uniref:IS66 family transposase n=1 Tax=Rubrivivax sp. RP6-9 TaxID=3415750 RepID=UPI003CC5696D
MDEAQLKTLDAQQLREVVRSLVGELQQRDRELAFKKATIDNITHEMAVLKRLKFAARSEHFNAEQKSLLEEAIDADLEALQRELEQLAPEAPAERNKRQPKREKLPEHLPRREIRHEPASTVCACGCAMKRIGEDVAEKLDYQPGVFSAGRHVRGKWVCAQCETLVQAPVELHVIDKGIRTAGLLAQVLVAKYVDHQPLYRQESIFGRAGLAIPRSTLAAWVGACGVQLQPLVDALKGELLRHTVLHADETPVAMLKPGNGKTHRAYLWSYCTTPFNPIKAVVFDFADSRAGRHAKAFLGAWRDSLVCDDYSGYKALFDDGVTEAGCLAHARRKFYDLWANHQSQIAHEALELFGRLYKVEDEVRALDAEARQRIRRERAGPWATALHTWLQAHRLKVPDGSATAKAIDYSLGRWAALVRYIDDGTLPADNNWVENQIRPIALGRSNWLFAGSLRAGQRAAAVMSLVHSARINGLDPCAHLRDVLQRLPTQPASRVAELLPHRWAAHSAA